MKTVAPFSILAELSARAECGLSCVRVGTTKGKVEEGELNFPLPSPLVLLCCEGTAHYLIREASELMEVYLEPGEILIMQQGTWIGVSPDTEYRSLGISLSAELVHAYMVSPLPGSAR